MHRVQSLRLSGSLVIGFTEFQRCVCSDSMHTCCRIAPSDVRFETQGVEGLIDQFSRQDITGIDQLRCHVYRQPVPPGLNRCASVCVGRAGAWVDGWEIGLDRYE